MALSSSKLLLSLSFALIISFIPLLSLCNNVNLFFFPGKQNHTSNFSIPCIASNDHKQQKWFTEKYKHYFRNPFIGFKNTEEDLSSRAIHIDPSKCLPVDLPPYAISSTNCCPPLPSPFKYIDFKDIASSSNNNTLLRVRKPCHLLDEEFIAKFEKGIALMKALPSDDPRNFYQQSKIHCAYCNGAYHQQYPFEDHKINIHRSWLFFPFHRLYLYFFEKILGNLIGDPSFALPFWNWDTIQGMTIPPYFSNPNSSLYDNLRHSKHMSPHVVDFDYDGIENYVPYEQQVSFNLAIMYKEMVLASTKELFMGSPLRLGDEAKPGMGSIESVPHNIVHDWVGAADTPSNEDMGAFYTAARDPIFYTHHSNVDRMWEIWKTLEGEEGRRDYSDDVDWLDTHFFFYDENANFIRVKVRDCLDTKNLGYVYQDVHLQWLTSPPTSPRMCKKQREAKIAKVLGSKLVKFPLLLNSIITTLVKRPKRLRCEGGKEGEVEEVLGIEGIKFGSDVYVKFDVHINDDEDKLSGPNHIEFVGSFVSLKHGNRDKVKTRYKVGISNVLENMEADLDDYVLLTLVPKAGIGEVTIESIKIEFIPKY